MLTLIGCGPEENISSTSQACENSAVVGTWQFPEDIVSFEPDCSFFSQMCAMSGTYSAPSSQSGVLTVKVNNSLGSEAGCFDPGTYHCTYFRGETYLDLDCPGLSEDQSSFSVDSVELDDQTNEFDGEEGVGVE